MQLSFSKPMLLSLCALTLLSACGKDQDDRSAIDSGANPVVAGGGEQINLPEERGPEGRHNERMISAGLVEANRLRAQRGLFMLAHDINLTIEAQRRARQLNQRGPGFPRNGDLQQDDDSFQHRNDVSDQEFGRDRNQNFGRNHRRPHFPQPQQPNFGTGENVARGARNLQLAFNNWMQLQQYRNNLLNPNFRRHGMGYSNGTWVHLFAY